MSVEKLEGFFELIKIDTQQNIGNAEYIAEQCNVAIALLEMGDLVQGKNLLMSLIEQDYGYAETAVYEGKSFTERVCLSIILKDRCNKKKFSLYKKWIKKLAFQGHVEFQYELGNILRYDTYLAILRLLESYTPEYWYRRAAVKGYAKAQNSLAIILKKSNQEEWQKWLEKASHKKDMHAEYNLALTQAIDLYSSPKKLKKFYNIIRSSADKGHIKAIELLAKNKYLFLNLEQLRSLAERNDAKAQYNLGMKLYPNRNMIHVSQGRMWLCRASKQGHEGAKEYERGIRIDLLCLRDDLTRGIEYDVEVLLYSGICEEESERFSNALFFYYSASQQNHMQAGRRLKDLLNVLVKLAEDGCRNIQYILGVFFEDQKADIKQAKYWYKKVAKQIPTNPDTILQKAKDRLKACDFLFSIDLGLKLVKQGCLKDAEQHLKAVEGLEQLKLTYKREDYWTLTEEAYCKLGEVLYAQNRFEEAKSYLEKVKWESSKNMYKYAQLLEELDECKNAEHHTMWGWDLEREENSCTSGMYYRSHSPGYHGSLH